MPRRAAPRQAETSRPPAPNSEPAFDPADATAQNILLLRTNWKWAAFSQFFYTFSQLLNMDDVALSDIENDLAAGCNIFLPRVMTRLLFVLSYDRKVSLDTWQSALRKQHQRRDPTSNPIGPEPASSPRHPHYRYESLSANSETAPEKVPDGDIEAEETHTSEADEGLEETKNWLDLPMLTKLDSMHQVAEWQFQNPTRLRTLMKSDDEDATWRIEPIGYDVKSNAYWLIGADRLWIQRAPEPSLKRKRLPDPSKSTRPRQETVKRPRLEGPGRAAKTKLDAQAKELEELNRATGSKRPSKRTTRNSAAPTRSLGTRVSARLRGTDEEEWQTIPDDWMSDNEGPAGRLTNPQLKTGLVDDGSSSELTELSEEEPEDREDRNGIENDKSPDPVEWETICVTLHDWEHISARFEGGTHYTEKSLYKVLTQHIVPVITDELREIERKRRLEEAIVHRKRSSRIAIKEQEKEAAQLLTRQKTEATENKTRAQRLEARLAIQEVERERREAARAHRKGDTDEDASSTAGTAPDEEIVVVGMDPLLETSRTTAVSTAAGYASGSTSGTRTPKGDDWMLNCEICGQSGLNVDDGRPLLCCGMCSEWQHISWYLLCYPTSRQAHTSQSSHDHSDLQAGRPRRNWEQVDFICSRCYGRRLNVKSTSQYVPSSSYASYHHNGNLVHTANATHGQYLSSSPYNSLSSFPLQSHSNGNGYSR
ncbi:hypothetical protein C8F01DRAFT_1065667 [Mycena amicta]|nr:hypothetical protein C8F01DRAFT_1065667 [Mycena amicta]